MNLILLSSQKKKETKEDLFFSVSINISSRIVVPATSTWYMNIKIL